MARSSSLAAALLACVLLTPAVASAGWNGSNRDPLDRVGHIVVIYEENHSFDNLYGRWEGVDGLRSADPAHVRQVDQMGRSYRCLLQNDVNLLSPKPLPTTCTDSANGKPIASAFRNRFFRIDRYIAPEDKTCPAPGVSAPNGVLKPTGEPGGCTRDLVHRFYQEQYQINGGQQNRYVTGSDAVGLTMGTYDTRRLPIYRYLHAPGAPRYVIADRFFQAAFGGSFLNHQWLASAATPTWPNAAVGGADDLHSVVDANGMPTSYPLYTSPLATVKDAALTGLCGPNVPAGLACGDYAVNTIQPTYQPYAPGTAAARQLPPQTHPTIGDRLSADDVDWAWYSGGWSNANGDVGAPGWTNGTGPTCSDANANANATFPNCPDKLFQFHHQPLNYFASFAPGTAARAEHLRDEAEFLSRAQRSQRFCRLKPVSFVKPVGAENEHPGYASEHNGSSHLVDLLRAVRSGRCREDTMIVVTYDEFGGQWDHVPPPGQDGTRGPHDAMGPGTRIPALVLAPGLRRRFAVDSVSHDTTSILATIEHRFGLQPLTSRDAAVRDLGSALRAGR
jgi:acid phosphatase